MFQLYGRSNCSFCDRAKQILDNHHYPYEYIDVGDPAGREALSRRNPLLRTVPQIFIRDHHVGGFNDLERGIANGTISILLGMMGDVE